VEKTIQAYAGYAARLEEKAKTDLFCRSLVNHAKKREQELKKIHGELKKGK